MVLACGVLCVCFFLGPVSSRPEVDGDMAYLREKVAPREAIPCGPAFSSHHTLWSVRTPCFVSSDFYIFWFWLYPIVL